MGEESYLNGREGKERAKKMGEEILSYLKSYEGKPLRLMEVCGTHTAQIAKNGIASLLSDSIHLISGPGCPVCVTVTQYLDRLVEWSMKPDVTVVSFGDLFRVPGSQKTLSEAKAQGGHVSMVYSPMEVLELAKKQENRLYVFAAVGFETTAPIYAMLLKKAREEKVENIKLLTSVKTMPPVIDWLCRRQKGKIDGFIAPGHVCVVTGTKEYEKIAKRYGIPFVVGGFQGMELLCAIAGLVGLRGKGILKNFYPSVVHREGNAAAMEAVREVFLPGDAAWRGMGIIPESGLYLSSEYQAYDAGSRKLLEDRVKNRACACAKVLTGECMPVECPLFGNVCTPKTPQGACMVSMEGSCFHSFLSRKGK